MEKNSNLCVFKNKITALYKSSWDNFDGTLVLVLHMIISINDHIQYYYCFYYYDVYHHDNNYDAYVRKYVHVCVCVCVQRTRRDPRSKIYGRFRTSHEKYDVTMRVCVWWLLCVLYTLLFLLYYSNFAPVIAKRFSV